MGNNVKVNTDAAVAAAQKIQSLNKQMNDGFATVRKAMTALDAGWEGPASSYAMSKFNDLAGKYPENRYNVVDNYVGFLLRQVGEGYESTEEANKKLAEAFK